jgi:Ohr subfamily peroxiredoxin
MAATQIENVLYTAKTHTTGGREGAARSSDGRLDVKLSRPGGIRAGGSSAGDSGSGTNPEQLFAAGWSACFIGAMGRAAAKLQVTLPPDVAVDAEVDLGTAEGEYFLRARLTISLPGLPRATAQAVAEGAHQLCPYSKMSRGNIDVTLNVI